MSSGLKWASADGSFQRQPSQFRSWVSKNGPHPPAPNRYVLYISLACPWAHRCLIVRHLKGLQPCIRLSVVHYLLEEGGWRFAEGEGCIPDPLYKAKYLSEVYYKSDPNYSGRFSVPVLFDSVAEKIVSNESADIIRMLNSEFNEYSANPSLDLYPKNLQHEIDKVNEWIYDDFNNGVYRAGFATNQEKYEEAAKAVHNALIRINEILERQKFIASADNEGFTEADIRLFTTVIRFQPVYFVHFKCNLLAIGECEGVMRWLKELFPLFKDTVDMGHIKKHYYMSHKQINPAGIVPLSNGPKLD